MGSLPQGRLVLRETVVVNESFTSLPHWVSALGTPREIAVIRVTRLDATFTPSLPVAYVQPWVLTDGVGIKIPIACTPIKAMDTARLIISRALVDPGNELRSASPPGQLNWGLQLRLINRCKSARVEYWQWS
jgi:hypothetical protein